MPTSPVQKPQAMTRYRCGFPGCCKRYASTDGARFPETPRTPADAHNANFGTFPAAATVPLWRSPRALFRAPEGRSHFHMPIPSRSRFILHPERRARLIPRRVN